MTLYTPDGGVVPSHIRAFESAQPADHGRQFKLRRGAVQRAVYPGEKENVTGQMEYIVTIDGQDYPACLDMTTSGGIFNSRIRIRKGAEVSIQGPLGTSYEEKKDGEAVFCMFVGADGDIPIIVGGSEHPLSNLNVARPKPAKSLGLYDRFEFNGLEFLIDKDGNYTIKCVGLKNAKTLAPVNPLSIGSMLKISKDGDFSFETSFGDRVSVSRADGIQGFTPAAGGTSISMKSGKVNIYGTVEITAADVLGAKLKIASGKVGLGTSAAEILDTVSKHLDEHSKDLQQLITAAPTFVSTAVGPGVLNPAVLTRLTTSKAAIDILKVAIDLVKGGV